MSERERDGAASFFLFVCLAYFLFSDKVALHGHRLERERRDGEIKKEIKK